ncbi:YcxB family protein [Saccharibacillus sp. CPCC 101409]|uniref:YcxB family protein n=1 Tax=Saccharibacillus sp. CPCC 101409 TaxID=3058041 RepID=UPI002671B3C8|nr:YcxB family protein [Saccharibacillus sp. CPCC 101409]MDO3411001.1 YcxB family protein [Saccharibacillus sp. CPCC 101409]
MEIKFEFTPDDLFQVQKDFVPRSSEHKKVKWMIYAFIALILGILVLRSGFDVSVLIVFLSWVIVFPFIYNSVALWSIRRHIHKNMDSKLKGSTTLLIGEEGIQRQTPLYRVFFNWSQFISGREIPGYYLLYVSAKEAFIIPKRGVEDKDDMQRLSDYFDRHLKFDWNRQTSNTK